jgi:hypothetical protein
VGTQSGCGSGGPTQGWLFEKINDIDGLLANLTKMRREKTQISKIRNAKGEIATNTMEI